MRKINFPQAILIFLLVLSVGFGCSYLVLYYLAPQTEIGQLGTRVLVLLVTGIGTGLVCRLAIPGRMWFLKILFGILGSLASIAILDWFFPGSFALLQKRTFPAINWSVGEYTQIGCLLLVTLLIALLGKKRAVQTQSEIQYKELKAARKPLFSPTIPKLDLKKKVKLPAVKLNTVVKKRTTKKTTRKKTAVKPTIKNPAPPVKVKTAKKPAVAKKKSTTAKKRSRNKDVKLNGTEEHRCPYCLEIVHKNDPRGVVICPDCGTWHHKDCWDITGSCQVAHKHKL